MNQRSRFSRGVLAVLIGLVLAIPFLLYLAKPVFQSPPEILAAGSTFPRSKQNFTQADVGPKSASNSQMTNVQIVDFDRDGKPEILVCDALRSQVLIYRRLPSGEWKERIAGEDLAAPAHATIVDLDGDGDNDIVVSVLGDLFPSDEHVGSVVWLEQTDDGFKRHLLLDDVRRVADVQAGDLDGDGDVDLAVAVFGYSIGEILWLENRGGEKFRDHRLYYAAGTIHVPLADYDGDGDLDIAAVVSQEREEVVGFENLGNGKFRQHRVFFTVNFDVGSAGLVQCDLNGDGKPDLLLPMGDNLEYSYAYPQPYHGCFWLENRGNWKFKPHRISSFGGAYAASVGDLDADGDRDVVLVSMVNNWQKPGNASVVWLENDGRQSFTTWQLARLPTHLTTVACGDINGDGRDDVVAGVLKIMLAREDKNGRVVSWMNKGK